MCVRLSAGMNEKCCVEYPNHLEVVTNSPSLVVIPCPALLGRQIFHGLGTYILPRPRLFILSSDQLIIIIILYVNNLYSLMISEVENIS